MLEWYRPGAGMDALIEEVSSLLRSVLPPVVCCRGVASDLSRFERRDHGFPDHLPQARQQLRR